MVDNLLTSSTVLLVVRLTSSALILSGFTEVVTSPVLPSTFFSIPNVQLLELLHFQGDLVTRVHRKAFHLVRAQLLIELEVVMLAHPTPCLVRTLRTTSRHCA